MSPDELAKLVWDGRCGPLGEEFFELLKERCLVGVGIDLTTMRKNEDGSVVAVLDPTMNISQPYLNLVQGKQSVYADLERWSQLGQKLCEVKSE